MIQLPPNAFTYGNYGADIPFYIFADNVLLLNWMLRHRVVGFSNDPSIKRQDGYIAVMFEVEDHGEYWSHIPEKVFNKYKEIV